MHPLRLYRLFRLFAATIVLTALPAVAPAAPPALSSYWPHEDGRHWTYEQSFEELYPDPSSGSNLAELYLDGTTIAPVGIAAQMLKGYVASARVRPRAAAGMPEAITDPLLRNLWIARPDLREGILRTSVDQPCVSMGVPGWYPLLLSGGLTYVQTASEIAAWRCDLANTRAWLWLTSNLKPGHVETIQLVPDLADDVFLSATIFGLEDATVPAGSFPGALRVDYKIDYGESMCTSPTGEPIGTSHYETNGFVRYASGVGPIESFEEFENFVVSGDPCPGDPPTGGPLARYALKLFTPSVPAHVASWGGVKAAYR